MCLGVPGRIVEVTGDGDLVMGLVDFGGVTQRVCLSYLPDARPGDYVVVHVGFAISRLDEDEARRTLETLATLGELWPDGETQVPVGPDVAPEPEPSR